MRYRISLFDLINFFILSTICFICLYPFINTIAISFSDGAYVMAGKVHFLPIHFNIASYKTILFNDDHNYGIVRGLFNSVLYTVLGTIVAVSATFLAAYCLSRTSFYGRSVMMLLILFTMLFDGGLVPNFLLLKQLGMIDSIWVMVIPGAVSAWLLIITRSFLDTQPIDLEESAFMDGANHFQIMYKIFLPLSTPVLATISIFYSVNIWNSYLIPVIYFRNPDLYPIQVLLQRLVIQPPTSAPQFVSEMRDGNMVYPKSLQAAITLVGMVPIMLVYPFAQKYFTKGILLGAIKG